MKSTSIKIVGWLFILLGVLIVVFSDYIHGHWPFTAFLSNAASDVERTTWATDSAIVISIGGVLICSVGMWLLSTWYGVSFGGFLAVGALSEQSAPVQVGGRRIVSQPRFWYLLYLFPHEADGLFLASRQSFIWLPA